MALFKDLRNKYLVTGIAGAILIVILCEMMRWKTSVYCIIALIYIFICVFVFDMMGQTRVIKMLDLMKDCRVQDFINQYLPLYDVCKAPWQKKNICLTLSTAYLNLGEIDKGMDYLERFTQIQTKRTWFIIPNSKEKLIAGQNAMYHNNMAVAYLRRDELEKAEEMLGALNEDIALIKTVATEAEAKEFQDVYKLKQILLAFKREDYSDYQEKEQYLTNAFECAVNNLNRVNYQYLLYYLYTGISEQEKAESCKKYVLAHGGDTYYKKTLEMY